MYKCEVCGESFKDLYHLSRHLGKHKIKSQDYYDKYMKKEGEGVCLNCGEPTIFYSFSVGYKQFCSTKCANRKNFDKRKQTNMEKYGVEYPAQNKEIMEKTKQTNLERYGSVAPAGNKDVLDKMHKTNFERYGVEHALQYEPFKQKAEETCMKNHGVRCSFESEEVQQKIQNTMVELYGVDHPFKSETIRNRSKETCMEHYGVENPFQSEEIKEKIKTTNIEKYGCESPMQCEEVKEKHRKSVREIYGVDNVMQLIEIQEKAKATTLEHHGVEYSFQSPEIRETTIKTLLEKYGVDNISKLPEIIEKKRETYRRNFYNKLFTTNRLQNKCIPLFTISEYSGILEKYPWKCSTCSTEFDHNLDDGCIPRCPTCYPPIVSGISKAEKEVLLFVQQYYPNVVANDKTILNGKELDIFIPEINLAIEFDGLYWHSELNGKNEQYHMNKTKEAFKKDIKLLHIFEDEWVDKQDIVKSILLVKMGKAETTIGARQCEIKDVNSKNAKFFLFENHLQGEINGTHFGLYYDNELVSLLTMGIPRYNEKYDWEILRFCNKKNTIVNGSLSKLISHFKQSIGGTIITYVDIRYGVGNAYVNAGFDLVSYSTPNYYYINSEYTRRMSRIVFQKHKLADLLEFFDPELTEWQNMMANGFDRIWDCGNFVFTSK